MRKKSTCPKFYNRKNYFDYFDTTPTNSEEYALVQDRQTELVYGAAILPCANLLKFNIE